MNRNNRRFAVLSLGVAMVAACQDVTKPLAPEPSGEPGPPVEASLSTTQAVERPHEAEFYKLSQEIRSFGGYSFDEQGNLVAFLKDPAEESRARQLLEPILRGRVLSAREKAQGSVVIRRGDYSFLELAAWRDRANDPVLDSDGVVFTDLDEAQNRLVVGVSSLAGRDYATRALREHRVPLEAVLFEETGEVEEDLSLQNYKRPIEGGYQIQRSGGGTCTLGFNAYWSGHASFLTNSHCTSQFWKTDGSLFYQNSAANADHLIGWEAHDPGPWSCGVFGWYKCRWSDAAVIRKYSSVPWAFRKIARTTSWAFGGPGSLTVDPSNPSMTITGEYAFPKGGEMFDKVGRTTGWTYGFVKKTCVDVNKKSLRRVRCQDFTNYYRDKGDSGSPVFRWHGSTVTLAGIHWGSIKKSGTRYSVMSAMWNIEADLGALTTF